MEGANIYLISSDKKPFEADLYFARKIKDINVKEGLDVVFARDLEKLPVLQRYCSRYNIITEELFADNLQENYSYISNYVARNPDKNTLATLIKEEDKKNLYYLFDKHQAFDVVEV